MPAVEQEHVKELLRHRTRQLTVSMYMGPFFRDARYLLLSDQPPGHLDLLRDPKGERIHPGDALGILPAGTEVRLIDVEFATASATTTRSLFTPRFFTWVHVAVPNQDRPGILVIRDEPENHEAFIDVLSRYLTTEDIRERLLDYPEDVREAIAKKQLTHGMDIEAARMAWGHPLQVSVDYEEGVRVESWRFEGERRLTVRDGKLVSWTEPKDTSSPPEPQVNPSQPNEA